MSDERPQNNDLWSQLVDCVADGWPPHRWRDVGVVVGCSGGADSVALVLALHGLRNQPPVPRQQEGDRTAPQGRLPRQVGGEISPPRGFLVVAHMNHGLRGADSAADAEFTESLAQQLGLDYRLGNCPTDIVDEATMRQQRLFFLATTAEQTGARYVTVAHNRDDNVETCLHHLMRGTGPSGLTGIAPFRGLGRDTVLARPMLAASRSLIRGALRQQGQPWREDASNQETRYRRNWIRGELIPKIESEYPCASAAIARLIESQTQWADLIRRQSTAWMDARVTVESTSTVRVSTCAEADAVIIIDALQCLWDRQGWSRGDMTQTHWQRIAQTIVTGQPQRYTLPGRIDVRASAAAVVIQSSS